MHWNRMIAVAFILLLQACKTTHSSVSAQTGCQDAGLLERVLSLVDPEAVPPDRRTCILQTFQQELDREKATTQDKAVHDRFDFAELQQSSSQLQGYLYTKDNIFDRKTYIKGPDNFQAHRRLIGQAQEEVLFQTYVWESKSDSAKEIMKGLQDLEQNRKKFCPDCRPVVVRIVANFGPTALDVIGAMTKGERVVDYGADARNAINALGLDPKVLDIQVLTYTHKAFGTNHVKSMVIDGQMAMITGANAQRFNDVDVNWYDVGYMMGGAVARGLRYDLINNLIRASSGTEKDANTKLADGLGTPYNKVFNTIYPIEKMMADPFQDKAGVPVVITSRNGNGIPSQSNNNSQNRAFQAIMQGAQRNIRIQTPNFNDDAAVRSLGAAVKRGVKLEMINSKLFNCQSENQVGQGGQNERGILRLVKEIGAPTPQGPKHELRWFAMMKDGQPTRVVDNTKGKNPEERPNNSHAKFMSVDDAVVVVGSANMDTQSWNQSRELNVLVFHPEVVRGWQEQVFTTNFAIAVPVTADEIRDESISCDMTF
ncbi:MAG TPA: phosphatidylserine/phosphatidylglycerophosphate/cardiolipin synthase family protein [Oligoflexus sp.]|uniref:phospholipase D-like domain-containing protein n=1 Tax=Oligoflexus sp. TaxID=1971216 RepID=UPI002D26974F|nr:phosphatidylserine/phosphatidylglycerophosphate/cardiolipin synthase family protein [Oligoflexus sp.]HYX32899.1 phosphatidylserine/phosphatidylglycerophosphate/cardiolipin synthase family protein [Oligoflexus sp.]